MFAQLVPGRAQRHSSGAPPLPCSACSRTSMWMQSSESCSRRMCDGTWIACSVRCSARSSLHAERCQPSHMTPLLISSCMLVCKSYQDCADKWVVLGAEHCRQPKPMLLCVCASAVRPWHQAGQTGQPAGSKAPAEQAAAAHQPHKGCSHSDVAV